jgi:hypothetical protein
VSGSVARPRRFSQPQRPSRFLRYPEPSRILALLALVLAGILGCGTGLAYAEPGPPPASRRALFAEFGFSHDQLRDVLRGRTVTTDVPAVQPNELAAAVATRLPVPASRFAERLRDGIPITADPHLRACARLDADPDAQAWAGARFGPAERDEAMRLFDVEPGLAFNLSAAEIAMLQAALPRPSAGDTQDLARRASAAFRRVLLGRYEGYLRTGLDGLAGYDRGGETSGPGEQLRRIEKMARHPPALMPLLADLAGFPAVDPTRATSRFYWKKTKIEGRPAFVLSQVMVAEDPEAVRFALREFYVSHTYNALEQAGIAVPDGTGGSLLLVLNSTMTDRIGGVFGGIARMIGQARSREALDDYISRLRDQSVLAAPGMRQTIAPKIDSCTSVQFTDS